ncbi:acyl-CoA dehydrogenase family protein [Pseudofrankia asymbiotica]|uniref:Acyl-CoA dehydrogenase n=1 Tax=Pseudofrankia asymbiotica TaxID=1834516 RepID=A0A1V2IF99_9ACTN|nr:acyl-CoA dehydrogenase family protein [Pseudofrankia asymbiotica]ONH31735.1 hypothetical protein BL253_08745 [Pseudofrankia asymbiotica]
MDNAAPPVVDDLEARVADFLERHGGLMADQVAFRGAQYDAGLAFVHFPVGLGGLGLPLTRQALVDEKLRDAGCTYHNLRLNPVGIGMVAPTILEYGTEQQKRRFLRPLFTGEEVWCQLFSEPGAGSDLAGLAARATWEDGTWVVNGQKVWNSLAHVASFGVLLARTDPDLPKHQGISYFLLDMRLPGIESRPLVQMTGVAEFNEVFLDDVHVPDDAMLGGRGDGWRIATTTLMSERAMLSGGAGGRGTGPVRTLLNLWARRRDALGEAERAIRRDQLADIWLRAEVVRLQGQRAKAMSRSVPGAYHSIGKLMWTELHQEIYEFCVDLEGADGMLHEAGYPLARADQLSSTPSISSQFLRSRASTLEGGTSEILRNMLGERLLDLPGEPRTDKNVSWRDIPR